MGGWSFAAVGREREAPGNGGSLVAFSLTRSLAIFVFCVVLGTEYCSFRARCPSMESILSNSLGEETETTWNWTPELQGYHAGQLILYVARQDTTITKYHVSPRK